MVTEETEMTEHKSGEGDARIVLLERQVRGLRRALMLLLVLLGAGLVLWMVGTPSLAIGETQEAKSLVANSLALRDARGRTRISLGALGTPGIVLYSQGGVPMAGLSVSRGISYLYLNDDSGRQRAVLSVLKDGFGLGLNDARGQAVATLRVGKEGPELTLRDRRGRERAQLTVTEKGHPTVVLKDGRGKLRAGLGVGKRGPMLDLRDEKGTARAGLKVDRARGSQLALRDAKGKVFFHKP
jgi:hypothetical protein